MTRVSKSAAAVAATLLLSVAWPATAQQIPTEGPAVNPAIYKVPANAKTIAVDCDDQKQTLAAAIADKTPGDLNIVFTGTCKEYLYITRDGVAIRGKDAQAALSGAIEIHAARRVLLENFTCRDNLQWEACIAANYGSSVNLHNIKVFNSSVRGVMIFNSTGLIDGLTVDKTISTSLLIRGSQARLEGDMTFSHTVEGCLLIDGVSSVFSKSANISARDCSAGVLIQSNSTFQAPFATFALNHNSFAGLMLITQGTLSYGGSITAKNNTQAGIFVDDSSSFAPFTNISGGSSLTLENNGMAGVFVRGGSFAELANIAANTGSNFGVFVEDSRLQIGKSNVTGNQRADIRLQHGSRATFIEGATYATLSCDGTEIVRGNKTACVKEEGKPTAKPTSAKVSDAPSPGAKK